MNKFIILVIMLMIFLTGCGTKHFVCSIDINNSEDKYTLSATYNIYYKKDYVEKIEGSEDYSSNEEKVLSYFNQYKKLEHEKINNLYGFYDYDVKLKNSNVLIWFKIKLSNMDLNKMVKDSYIDSYYVKQGKLKVSGIKYYFERKGATCSI